MIPKEKTVSKTGQNEDKPFPGEFSFDEKLFAQIFLYELCGFEYTLSPTSAQTRYAPIDVCESVDRAVVTMACKILGLDKTGERTGQDWLCGLLKFEEFRDLKAFRMFKVSVKEAIKQNSCDFFIQVGKALSVKPKSIKPVASSYRLEIQLVKDWVSLDPEAIGLSAMSDEQIVVCLQHALPNMHGINSEAVRKKWLRLGLKKDKLLKRGRIMIGRGDAMTIKRESGKWAGSQL